MRENTLEIENIVSCPIHIKTVAKWVFNEFRDGKPGRTLEYVVDRFKNRKLDTFPMSFIAKQNGNCVGVISIFDNDLETKPELTPWLAGLYVDEEFRGAGIAEKLINKVIEVCKNKGYKNLYLRTEHTSEYYRKKGWEFIEETSDEYGHRTSVFTKKL